MSLFVFQMLLKKNLIFSDFTTKYLDIYYSHFNNYESNACNLKIFFPTNIFPIDFFYYSKYISY